MEQSTTTQPELLYEVTMMNTILHQDSNPNNHKKTLILNKTKENKEDCVSKNLTVAVISKITSHIITSLKVEKIICKKQKTHVNNFHHMTHPGLDICYISQNLQHYFLDKKESSLILLTQYNISYQNKQQRAQGKRKKAIPSLERNIKAKIQLNSNYNTPIFMVAKKGGPNPGTKKFVQDFRKRNAASKDDRYTKFDEFCRCNNIRLKFKENISDKPIISFQSTKEFIPNQWRIRNIDHRFIIKELLNTSYRNGKYYKLKIKVADRFQHLNALKQAQYQHLLQQSDPWKQCLTKLTSKHYHILPTMVETHKNITNEQNEPSKAKHELIIQGSCFPIEYLQYFTIIDKDHKPNIIHISITLQDTTKTFIMVKNNPMNHIIRTKYYENKIPNRIRQKPRQRASLHAKTTLMSQFDTKGIDKTSIDDYNQLILDNWDVFSLDTYRRSCTYNI